MQKQLTQEQLNEVVVALNILARHGLLYGGFRKKQRKIVEVRLSRVIAVKYEDGELRYLNPFAGRTHHFYIHLPPP
jgi:hypothetical protein